MKELIKDKPEKIADEFFEAVPKIYELLQADV